jgi:hypothetical protein
MNQALLSVIHLDHERSLLMRTETGTGPDQTSAALTLTSRCSRCHWNASLLNGAESSRAGYPLRAAASLPAVR